MFESMFEGGFSIQGGWKSPPVVVLGGGEEASEIFARCVFCTFLGLLNNLAGKIMAIFSQIRA